MTNQERWLSNYEVLNSHVLETGHFCDKQTRLCDWGKFQRKLQGWNDAGRAKELFQEFEGMRSGEHTGGRKKKINL